MGIFSSQKTFKASGEFIPAAMKNIREAFSEKGYKFNVKSESCGRTIIEVQLRLSGGPKSLTKNINIEKFAKQAEMYEEILAAGKAESILQKVAVMDESHPFSAVRVHEILDWTKSKEFETVKDLYEGKSLICPTATSL